MVDARIVGAMAAGSKLVTRIRARLADASVDGELERTRERIEARHHARLLAEVRGGRDVCWEEEDDEPTPLVTVRIATYNRASLLAERSLPSVLAQSYERLDVLVIGDGTDEATDRFMGSVRDPRVRYLNLPRNGLYPREVRARWLVAGSQPMNIAIALAKGAWVAPCDDDDEMTPDHVEILLGAAKARRLEMVYSRAEMQQPNGEWITVGREPLQAGSISHGTVLYSMGLRFLRYSDTCWKLPEPFDWNLWRRMRDLGVRIGFVPETTFRHFDPEA